MRQWADVSPSPSGLDHLGPGDHRGRRPRRRLGRARRQAGTRRRWLDRGETAPALLVGARALPRRQRGDGRHGVGRRRPARQPRCRPGDLDERIDHGRHRGERGPTLPIRPRDRRAVHRALSRLDQERQDQRRSSRRRQPQHRVGRRAHRRDERGRGAHRQRQSRHPVRRAGPRAGARRSRARSRSRCRRVYGRTSGPKGGARCAASAKKATTWTSKSER